MNAPKIVVCVATILAAVIAVFGSEGTFSTFPDNKAGLPSPNGKFIVRSVEYKADSWEFGGNHQSLLLENAANGKSRKLCDYLGHTAVTWATDNLLIVNEYFTNRGARMRLVAADETAAPVIVDKKRLAALVPGDVGQHLSGNDHVYVEGYKLDRNVLGLRVWGYGALDAKGFSLKCNYNLDENTAACSRDGAR